MAKLAFEVATRYGDMGTVQETDDAKIDIAGVIVTKKEFAEMGPAGMLETAATGKKVIPSKKEKE